jgi:phage terminase large subunit-like protein
MSETLTKAKLDQYRRDVVRFAEEQFYLPKTGKPIRLAKHQKKILRACLTPIRGKMPYSTIVYSCPKKSGKTTIGALVALWWALSQEPYNEIILCANDEEQAKSRVFKMVTQSVKLNPHLGPVVTNSAVTFPETDTAITAIASEYAGAAGADPGLTVWDELWAYQYESSRRLYEELTPSPTRKNSVRLIVTYAGFEGESLLLKELYDRGMKGERIDDELPIYVNGGLFMYWDHRPRMPWQTPEYYEDQRAALRPSSFARMHRNQWVSSESTFIEPEWFDACVDPELRPMLAGKGDPIFVGVDAATKRDSLAVAGVYYDRDKGKVVLAFHRIWEPKPGEPLDLEETVENYLLEQAERFRIKETIFDPYQMARSASTMKKAGIRMREFPQTVPNLTLMGDNLFALIKNGNLMTYSAPEIRLALSRAVAIESSRGWRIAKEKQSHKIDIVVALGMASLAAVQRGSKPKREAFCASFSREGGMLGRTALGG